MDMILWGLLIIGLLLIVSELFHASLFTAAAGIAAWLVAILYALGLVGSIGSVLAVWALFIMILAMVLRPLMKKIGYAGDKSVDKTHLDDHMLGNVVEVVDTIVEENASGTIRLHGTLWKAQSIDGVLKSGTKVKLVKQKSLVWYVEPVLQLETEVIHEAHMMVDEFIKKKS